MSESRVTVPDTVEHVNEHHANNQEHQKPKGPSDRVQLNIPRRYIRFVVSTR
jgi:hypothetical protein